MKVLDDLTDRRGPEKIKQEYDGRNKNKRVTMA
jgi:hypothetical protein